MAFSFFKKDKKKDEGVKEDNVEIVDSEDDSTPETEAVSFDAEEDVITSDQDIKSDSDGFFARLKRGLEKTRKILTTDVDELFSLSRKIDDDLLEEIEEHLITADIGVRTTLKLMDAISQKTSKLRNAYDVKSALKSEISIILSKCSDHQNRPFTSSDKKPYVVLVAGVNGVGKTTSIGKIASQYSARGKKVIIAAADTFRAAAAEQLGIWAERAGADLIRHKDNSDPAAVAFDAVSAAVSRKADVVLIDTAGRLHTKVNLMEELKKIRRSIEKALPGAPHDTIMVVDATTGQNALSQAKLFNDEIGITGIVLTKLDGTAKGGIVVAISDELDIPICYIGVGEQVDDLQEFKPDLFAEALF